MSIFDRRSNLRGKPGRRKLPGKHLVLCVKVPVHMQAEIDWLSDTFYEGNRSAMFRDLVRKRMQHENVTVGGKR